MHVIAIIGGMWIMIIGAFIFIPIGNFLGVKAENLAGMSAYFFIYFIFVFMLIDPYIFNPSKIKGKIIEYSKRNDLRKMLFDVLIETENGEFLRFKKMAFEEPMWKYVDIIHDMHVFFVDNSKFLNCLEVWGVISSNGQYEISRQIKKHITPMKTFFVTTICLILIYFVAKIAVKSSGEFEVKTFLFFGLFPITFLIQWYTSYPYKKRFFENRMRLLDEFEIRRPLIWS